MEYYDVIIVGAGIAGCGLAYNLKRIGYKGRVLVIDKERVGANGKDRLITEDENDAVKEYNLPYRYKFKGIKIGTIDNVLATIDGEVYVINYKKIATLLLQRSGFEYFRKKALGIMNNSVLITDDGKYSFKYLIDCSGIAFFLRNLFNFPKPFRYWVGVRKELRLPPDYDKRYYYNLMDSRNRYLDEYLYNGKSIDYCKWQSADIRTINPIITADGKEGFLIDMPREKFVEKKSFFYFPGSMVFPLVYKNFAFLGDSFGNSPPQSGFGVDMIFKSSKILAKAIYQKNLKYYSKKWKSKYYNIYLKHLTLRIDRSNIPPFLEKIKRYPALERACKVFQKYPKTYLALIQNHFDFEMPSEVKKLYPLRQNFFLSMHYLYIRINYLLMALEMKIINLHF